MHLVLRTAINPHGLCFASPFKAYRFVEVNCLAICRKHLLVELTVNRLHYIHHFAANPFTMIFWLNTHMWIVHDKMTVRNCVANTD
ncbi:hypothetical protein LY04_03425 [Oceanimonas baumannii]|uniref:Fatty acid hydroxylase domain-containing protein n=1 Tax=Oceanimonas baumannii TaxID=129578 RepID=A0ABY2EUQ2_9GAMM|nr:hypothetical protein LY04_03425 [Oceanimonas baumannii]